MFDVGDKLSLLHINWCMCMRVCLPGGVLPHATEVGPGGEQHRAPTHQHHLQLQEATRPPHPQALAAQACARHPG